MKMLQLVDIGTKASEADLEGDVETLIQIPIDSFILPFQVLICGLAFFICIFPCTSMFHQV